jgi:hypothetical protein
MQSTGGQKRRIQWKQTFQGNKREKRKKKIDSAVERETGQAHLLLPSSENEDGGESHPADEGQKTHAAQTHDTNKTTSRRLSLFQHTRTTKE